MKPDIIVAVNHDAASIGVELLVVLHPPMSRQVFPEANEYTFAKFTLKDRCHSGCLPVAQLVVATFGPAAVATLALAPPVKLVQDVLAVAHKARRLPHRLAFLCFLAVTLATPRCSSTSSPHGPFHNVAFAGCS